MISRDEVLAYVRDKYQTEPDYPWQRYPDYAVLRHQQSGKWFAVLMEVTEKQLGLDGGQRVEIINLKCDPFLRDCLSVEPGVFPAYHMSKEHWLTIRLDSPFPTEKLFHLLDLSYLLTKPAQRRASSS